MKKLTEKLNNRLRRYSGYWWYYPFVSALAAIDLFVGVIPTEFLVIASVWYRPHQWIRSFIFISAGSAFGAFVLAEAVSFYGMDLVQQHFLEVTQTEAWTDLQGFLGQYGWIALFLITVGPIPQQPAVMLCALSAMSPFSIAAAVFLGRALKYGGFAWLALRGKTWLLPKDLRAEIEPPQ